MIKYFNSGAAGPGLSRLEVMQATVAYGYGQRAEYPGLLALQIHRTDGVVWPSLHEVVLSPEQAVHLGKRLLEWGGARTQLVGRVEGDTF